MAADPGARTLFRRALQKALHEQLRDERGEKLLVIGHELRGPQERDIGCVWWEQKAPHARARILEENTYGIRIFCRFKQDQGADDPASDQGERIEKLSEDLEDALAAILTLPWLQAVSGLAAVGDMDHIAPNVVRANSAEQYVEAAVVAFATNRASRGG